MKIALTNIPAEQAEGLAETLVSEHRVACVNLYPIQSVYFWKDVVRKEPEVTLMMKVSAEGVEALKKRVVELHPYELPEFVVLDVDTRASLDAYVTFVRDGTAT